MEYRFVLAFFVMIGGAMAGREVALRMKRRVFVLERLSSGLALMRSAMLIRREPLAEALRASANEIFEKMAELLSPGVNAVEAWRKIAGQMRKRGEEWDCLTDSEIGVLDNLFAQIGCVPADAVDLEIRSCIAALDIAQKEAREKAETACKLYAAIGGLSGLAAAVLLI